MIWRLLIVYTLVPAGCKRQIAQSIAAGIGHFFGDLAAEHAVQLVAGVDICNYVDQKVYTHPQLCQICETKFGRVYLFWIAQQLSQAVPLVEM